MRLSQRDASRMTSNGLLQEMRTRPRTIVIRNGKYGPVYSRLPPSIVERQISKCILVPAGNEGLKLSQAWSGR